MPKQTEVVIQSRRYIISKYLNNNTNNNNFNSANTLNI